VTIERPDFFISYNSADRAWAEWIAWHLEHADFTTVLQAWDFRPGSNFVVEMNRATGAQRTIAVLSPEYLGASFPQPEWAAAFAHDPEGLERTLVPVRVRVCQPTGLLAQIVYIDLVGLDEEAARERLLEGVAERGKPLVAPTFPGGAPRFEAEEPVYPGETQAVLAATDSEPRGIWIKLDNLVFPVSELDDHGDTIRIKGQLDGGVLRRLEELRDSPYGRARVNFVHGNRVVEGQLAALRRTAQSNRTDTEIQLERVEVARGTALRAGTGGLSADDLIEAGLRHLLLGEALPQAVVFGLESLADPGVNGAKLVEAFLRPDLEAEQAVRLVLAEALIRHGHASAVTKFELGPLSDGVRHILLEWKEPRAYVNVEPQIRRLQGDWHST
jgi:TIR domain